MTNIHPSAVIEQGAQIDPTAKVGAFCIVGAQVKLAAGVQLVSHVSVTGETEIGEGTKVFPFASLGSEPQDLKFHGEKSQLIIGKNNKIREHVTMNGGTEGGGHITRVGDNCLFMMGSHVAHDCVVGSNVILANNATLAGHVQVGDFAIIGGLAAIHQFVRIGHHAMVGGMSGIENDVIPFGNAFGERASLQGLNLIGLKRRNFSRDEISDLRAAFKDIFEGEGNLAERTAKVSEKHKSGAVAEIINFIQTDNSRSICTPKKA